MLRLCTCLLLDGILWSCLISPFLLGLASGLQFPGLFPTLCNPTLQEKLLNYNKELLSEKLLHVRRMQCLGAEDMAPLMTCLLRYHEDLSWLSVIHLTWRTARGCLPATTRWHGLLVPLEWLRCQLRGHSSSVLNFSDLGIVLCLELRSIPQTNSPSQSRSSVVCTVQRHWSLGLFFSASFSVPCCDFIYKRAPTASLLVQAGLWCSN